MWVCCTVLYATAFASVGVTSHCVRIGTTLWVTDCVVKSHADTLTTGRHRYISGIRPTRVWLPVWWFLAHVTSSQRAVHSELHSSLRKQLTVRCWTSCGGLGSKDVEFINYLIDLGHCFFVGQHTVEIH